MLSIIMNIIELINNYSQYYYAQYHYEHHSADYNYSQYYYAQYLLGQYHYTECLDPIFHICNTYE
jgi:hypothetical protein